MGPPIRRLLQTTLADRSHGIIHVQQLRRTQHAIFFTEPRHASLA